MNTKQISAYIGIFKRSLLNPYNNIICGFGCEPTMYVVIDKLKSEADIILLAPSAYIFAYSKLIKLEVKSIRIFVPSLRPEFISDVFNLYMAFVNICPIKWIFPDKPYYPHTDFESGQIKTSNYLNEYDSSISISYVKNDNVDDVYDIIVRDENNCKYFSQYLTSDKLVELHNNVEISSIEIPFASTIYGGLSYKAIETSEMKKYLTKINPHSFTSIEDYELYSKNK